MTIEYDDLPLDNATPTPAAVSEPPAPPSSEVTYREPHEEPMSTPPADLPPALGSKIEGVLAHLRRRRRGEEKPIETPWPNLNDQLGGGWWPGVHVLISGTGAGKSQLIIEASTDAADQGRAVVGYAALELDDVGVLSRVASRLAQTDTQSLSWSAISRGEVDPDSPAMTRAFQRMSTLPFHLDTGSTVGWSVSNLETMAKGLRQEYPGKPLLLVVDFLQLVGGTGERGDLRERIGRAAYLARQVAREYQAAIVLVSSTARQNYNLFGDNVGFTAAGLATDGARRIILAPDVLVGLGKETGEIEYAADSVTVMGRIPRDRIKPDPEGFSPVVLATAKLRAGPPAWCALNSNGQTFRPWPSDRTSDVVDALTPQPKQKASGSKSKGPPSAPPPSAEDDCEDIMEKFSEFR